MAYVIAFAVSFGSTFFKAFQGRNFAFANYVAVMPTSILVAACELNIVALIARGNVSLGYILAVGSGAGFGGMIAIYLHARFWKRKTP